MRDFLRALRLIYKENKGLLILLIILSFSSAAISATLTQFLKIYFDLIEQMIRQNVYALTMNPFGLIMLIYAALFFLETIINASNNFYTRKWWFGTRNKIVTKTFAHFQSMSLPYFENNSTGKIKERIDRGVMDMLNSIQSIILDIAPQVFYILIAAYFLFKINYIFGLIHIVTVSLYVVVSLAFRFKIGDYQREARELEERASGKVIESIINIRTIKSFAREKLHLDAYSRIIAGSYEKIMMRRRLSFRMVLIRGSISDIASILILTLGAINVVTGKISMGTLILAWAYTNQSFRPLGKIARQIDEIQADFVSVGLVLDFLKTKPSVMDDSEALQLKNVKGVIEINNISFFYQKIPVIEKLSLKIKEGEIVALVGKSGAGKSTLVKLLLRFYDPGQGTISIDGNNIKGITQDSLRRNIGTVMEDTMLFNDTVVNNIRYGNLGSTKNEIIKAAKAANAHDFIKNLPNGYETEIGERGVRLSSGEQQRINIARAFLKNAPILILDEATSNLDSESETLIQDSLWKLIQGRTTIIIAHRLSTVMKADRIIVLDQGKIIEEDTHQALIKGRGIYSKLFKIQSGGYLK